MSESGDRPVTVERLQMPIRWVVSLVVVVVAGALAVAGVAYRAEGRLLPQKAIDEGGVVSKTTLRRVLRKMTIACSPTAPGGLSCTVSVPEEAD
jgi:hypothetical protein